MPFVVGKMEGANGDGLAFAGAQRADDCDVGATGEVDVIPAAGVGIAPGCGADAIQEGFNDPRVPADRSTAEAVAPPAVILNVVDAADGNGADAQGIIPAHRGRGEVLAEHGLTFRACDNSRRRPCLSGRSLMVRS